MQDTTSGSDTREARTLDAPEIAFELAAELDALRAEASYTDFGRTSKTLARSGPLRLVLTAVRAGVDVGAHLAEGPIAIHVLEGEVVGSRDGSEDRFVAGTVAWFSAGGGWSVRAERDAALLLSVAGDDRGADEASR